MDAKDTGKPNGGVAMDVDYSPPPQVILKRSSSAPMINEISTTMSVTSPSTSTPPRDSSPTCNAFATVPRSRRFSTSSPGNGGSIGPKLTPRVNQLRQEECIDAVACRELAHEKEIHSAMQISQSWEDLTLEAEGLSFKDCRTESPPPLISAENSSPSTNKLGQYVAKKIFDPLSLNLSSPGPPMCSSPSPTRSGLGQRQCYSPLQMITWKNGSSSPSPTRKAFATRRSLSPVAIRPSCLSGSGIPMKRKFELDSSTLLIDPTKCSQPPAKRNFTASNYNSSRLESILSSSPGPVSSSGYSGSAGTPESLSSADSPSFSFQTTEDSPSTSHTSNHIEYTSMSDNSNDQQVIQSDCQSETSQSTELNDDR